MSGVRVIVCGASEPEEEDFPPPPPDISGLHIGKISYRVLASHL